MKTITLLTVLGLAYGLPASAQTCNDAIVATTPSRTFTDNGDGTVRHRKTGLIWMRCPLGQNWDGSACNGTANTYHWQDALLAVRQLNKSDGFAGKHNWRLPNSKELSSIVERRCSSPALNTGIFPLDIAANSSNAWFWSSTYTVFVKNSPFGEVNSVNVVEFESGTSTAFSKVGIEGESEYLAGIRLVRGR